MASTAITYHLDSLGITEVPGFKASGVPADIRETGNPRLDVALFFSEAPCAAAGTFTTNDIKAAPVRLCQEFLCSGDPIHGVISNSGNANACTGPAGMRDAREMAAESARLLGLKPDSILVCSTGRIGRQLPMAKIRKGITSAVQALDTSDQAGRNASEAILTSDTRPKTISAKVTTSNGNTITLGGMAKGAGMIEPNMATMLAYVATDAAVPSPILQQALSRAVQLSFNTITVDGDMSTNDTVLCLANGASDHAIDSLDSPDGLLFQEALNHVCFSLAEKIVGDGEKVTKLVTLLINGAPTEAAAEKVGRAIGNSLLVKSSWYGSDPNWGRLLDAAGYARIGMVEERVDLFYNDIPVLLAGTPQDENLPKWKAAVAEKRFTIRLEINQGEAAYRLLAADLTEGYVNFNKSE